MTMSFAAHHIGRRSLTSCRRNSLLRCSSYIHINNYNRQLGASNYSFPRRALSSSGASSSRRPAKYTAIYSSQRILPLERPVDPSSFSSSKQNNDDDDEITEQKNNSTSSYVRNQTQILKDWFSNKRSVICLTGAGMSTESGIPDYRGNKGSYFRGHKPIIHHEYMSSEQQRKRYWARSLVGYSPFANAKPNSGHEALARLEEKRFIGIDLEACADFDNLGDSCFGGSLGEVNDSRRLSIITQNVDTLHSKAGVKHCLHLHGRGDLVKCMNCGFTRDRKEYHGQLLKRNKGWFDDATAGSLDDTKEEKNAKLRPDGDAELGSVSYDELVLPPCPRCGEIHDSTTRNRSHQNIKTNGSDEEEHHQSFFKTDVVFFGDSVPKHRFDISYAAVDAADGILCIGTSLAVHSAFRLVKRAIENGTPVAILNVGQTRVEKEGLGANGLVTKLESPIGETLAELVKLLEQE